MAAGGSDACASIRHAGSTAHERGPAGPVVAFCRGDRCVGSRVGMATARGPALMGGALWERLARVFGRSARERSEAERILLEADFGVEATEEILDRVSGAKDGDHDFRSALERAVIGALTPAAPSVAPGALAHAPAPPTVILVFGVNGVGKTTAVAKLGARLAHEGRDRKSTRLNSSHLVISYAVFCLKKKKNRPNPHAIVQTVACYVVVQRAIRIHKTNLSSG